MEGVAGCTRRRRKQGIYVGRTAQPRANRSAGRAGPQPNPKVTLAVPNSSAFLNPKSFADRFKFSRSPARILRPAVSTGARGISGHTEPRPHYRQRQASCLAACSVGYGRRPLTEAPVRQPVLRERRLKLESLLGVARGSAGLRAMQVARASTCRTASISMSWPSCAACSVASCSAGLHEALRAASRYASMASGASRVGGPRQVGPRFRASNSSRTACDSSCCGARGAPHCAAQGTRRTAER